MEEKLLQNEKPSIMQQLFYVGGSMEEWIVDASCGRIRGRKTENGYEFLGIPYGMASASERQSR